MNQQLLSQVFLYRPVFHRAVSVRLSAILLLTVLGACSSLPLSKPESPTVTVAGVRPVSLGLIEQTIGLTLRIANPNGFSLPMQSLNFNAHFSGKRFAQGRSIENVVIPAKGEALLDVEVTAGLAQLANQIKLILNSSNPELNYDVTGLVKLSNWPKAIPFNVEGELDDPRPLKFNEAS